MKISKEQMNKLETMMNIIDPNRGNKGTAWHPENDALVSGYKWAIEYRLEKPEMLVAQYTKMLEVFMSVTGLNAEVTKSNDLEKAWVAKMSRNYVG